MTERTTLTVMHPNGSYNITFGRNLYGDLRRLANMGDADYVVITDSNVGPLYANRFPDALAVFTVPAGEEYKTLETINALYGPILNAGLDRKGYVVAVGGGVVGDMAGFVAASFMRGVKFVQCPTSLLSMVDASVGGKVGVDLPEGKNLVGAFKQPEAVLISLDTLSTLPAHEFASGMAEIIKAGIIDNPELFEYMAATSGELSAEHPLLANVVLDAVQVKQDVVQRDPYELSGIRALLNLGHTFGHSIEKVSNFEVLHGFGVAMGMIAAARVSAELGHCSADLPSEVERVIAQSNLPTRIPAHLDTDEIIQSMHSDKKKAKGKLRFILPKSVGECFMTADVPRDLLVRTLDDLKAA